MWGYNGYLKNARFRTEEEGLQDARYLDPNGTTGLTIVREEYDPKKAITYWALNWLSRRTK